MVQGQQMGVSQSQFARLAVRGFSRREPAPVLSWCEEHVRFPATWESAAFDLSKMPHVRGFIERFWLDPSKRKANLPWSVRSGKTTTLLALICWVSENAPAPMGVLFPDRGMLRTALVEHIYPMFERTRPVSDQLLPRHKRNSTAIVLRDCRVRLANAGSLSDASGWPARYIFKFEHDKCPVTQSREADSSRRIESRTAGYARGVKIVEEGSPGRVSESRAARLLRSKTVQQVRYLVPCPHCGEYRQLKFEQLKIPADVVEKLSAMRAYREAKYHCEECDAIIEDYQRPAMMQRGRWVIEGEYCDRDGNVLGVPAVDSDTMVFGEYNALYSLFAESFGTVAKEYIEAREAEREGDQTAMMKFETEVLAKPYDDKPAVVEVSALAKHLAGKHDRGQLPAETAFLTTTADIGMSGDQMLFHWQVMAWWAGAQGAVVDWGLVVGVKEWLEWVAATRFAIRDQPEIVLPVADFPVAMDSGKWANDVCDVADLIPSGFPIKGDSTAQGNQRSGWYYPGTRKAGLPAKLVAIKKKLGVDDLVMINSELTQQYRQSVVSRRKHPGFAGHVVLPRDVCEQYEQHEYYFLQLQADHKQDGKWVRAGANEAGDNLRYGRAVAERYVKGGIRWKTIQLADQYQNIPAVVSQRSGGVVPRPGGVSQFAGGGQSYLISNRK